ncbi:MAG: hypothetical protein WC302_00690 [Candidatus Paceibacterota bacterium]
MKIILNGQSFEFFQEVDMLRALILFNSNQLSYQPVEGAKENVLGITDMMYQFIKSNSDEVKVANKVKRRELQSLMRRISIFQRFFRKVEDRETLISRVFDFLLALDGLSTLPGFGFSNRFKDRLKGNAEKISLRKVHSF